MKIILQYFDDLDRVELIHSKLEEEDIIIDMRIYEHFLRNVYEADFKQYLIDNNKMEDMTSSMICLIRINKTSNSYSPKLNCPSG